MAKTRRGEKTAAVQEYINSYPDAMPAEIAAALKNQGITITPGHVSTIKGKLKKAGHGKKAAKPAAKTAAAPVAVKAAPAKANGTITLEQIRKVAQTVHSMGGLMRMTEVLEVIKEAGGVKKFRELAEAMAGPEADDIPF
jgi:hypothetical protein